MNSVTTKAINTFEDALKKYGFIDRSLEQTEIDEIKEAIKEHSHCHELWNDSELSDDDMLEIAVYGKGDNVAIECLECNNVIYDSTCFEEE